MQRLTGWTQAHRSSCTQWQQRGTGLRPQPWRLRVGIVLLLLLALSPGVAQAAPFTVLNADDAGTGSLRQAIEDANAAASADTITFDASLTGSTIILESTLPAITAAGGALTIDGEDTEITVSGNHTVQVMHVDTGATFTVQNLTIANGSSSSFGGGINNAGTLTVTNSTFSGNSAEDGGGGINNAGTLTVTNSTFSSNSDDDEGGGISNAGTLTVTNSTFSSNSAFDFGGGIFNNGTLTVTNSTFSGNSVEDDSGGGGIENRGTATFYNTIITNSPSGSNCAGTILNGGGNLQFPGTSCGATILETDPRLDPAGLQDNGGPTQTIALCTAVGVPHVNCTGPSPALDTGDDTICAAAIGTPTFGAGGKDQRGATRPQDGNGDMSVHCDIGAFEVGALCGNEVLEGGETCDDGNLVEGDCCSLICQTEASDTVCRSADGQCDVAETCDGSSTCPADAFQAQGTTCRGADGQCDVAESCSGTSGSCPTDGFAASTVSCTGTSQGGLCDNNPADHCAGGSNSCVDAFQAAGFTCRDAAGECDITESCSGTTGTCPSDGKKAINTPCPADSDLCSRDICDGSTDACTHPPFQPTNGCIVNGKANKPCVGTSTLVNVIVGTPGPDVIIGTNGFDTIAGGSGDDLICGRAGNDILFGSAGNDQLVGEGGTDLLSGDAGNDILNGGPGNDILNGGAGSDQCAPGDLNILCNP